jgi:hypothetical protein
MTDLNIRQQRIDYDPINKEMIGDTRGLIYLNSVDYKEFYQLIKSRRYC